VSTDKGTRYMCRDFLPEGCPCKANWSICVLLRSIFAATCKTSIIRC
jgi:hypothetical protein